MYRKAKWMLLLTLLCLLLAGAALADDAPGLTITRGDGAAFSSSDHPVDGVELLKRGEVYYVMLPAGWDRADLRVLYTAADPYTVDVAKQKGLPLPSGEPTNVFALGDELKVRRANGRILCTLRVMQGSLPSMFVKTRDHSLAAIHSSKEVREPASLFMQDQKGITVYAGELDELRTRGNATFEYPKKPYQIKLAKKTALLGSGEAKTWILLADYLDFTLLRNRLTLDVARYIGMRYAVWSESVDLYIDGEYKGVYLLTDKVQIGKNRVDVFDQEDPMSVLCDQPLESYPKFKETLRPGVDIAGYELPAVPKDITGGYLLEVDKAYRVRTMNDCYVFTPRGMGFLIDEPNVASREQVLYIEDKINAFDRAIRTRDGVDPQTDQHYTELFDLDSLVLKFLLEDMSMNYDAKAGSQYFYKDRDSEDPLIYAGPGWDYDLTYANCLNNSPYEPFLTNMTLDWPWWTYLYKQPDFKARADELLKERMLPALEILTGQREPEAGVALRSLKDYDSEIAASSAMNFVRWRPGGIKGNNKRMGSSHKEGMDMLQLFLERRIVGMTRIFFGE